jgi:hypothetical protein
VRFGYLVKVSSQTDVLVMPFASAHSYPPEAFEEEIRAI